jgi:4-hydroxymandelate oxidase
LARPCPQTPHPGTDVCIYNARTVAPLDDLLTVSDFEAQARAQMEPSLFDYYAGGAETESTLSANREAFTRVVFRPRVLVDVSSITLSTPLLGHRLACPVLLAPTAFNRLGHPDGERAAAKAAGAAGTVMVVSTMASTSIEEIADAATGPLWFQLYVFRDRGFTQELVKRAEAAGVRALVLTVDAPRLGRRERDARNHFALPPGITVRNLETSANLDLARWSASSSFFEYTSQLWDPSLTWNVIGWLRSITTLPIVLKGVLAAEDAARAIGHGVDAIAVSNHGGRQLDGTIATLDALPAIAATVAGRVPLLLDGGVRRGTDIVKALALGATAVMIGRPYLWGLAAAGEAGARRVLDILRAELELALALVGCADVRDLSPSFVTVR